MKFVYWNSKRHAEFSTISAILTHVSPDVLFLAETEESLIVPNYGVLGAAGYEHFQNPGCKRILIIKKIATRLNLSKQSDDFSALRDPENNIIIISVHMSSQMHHHMDELTDSLNDFRHDIDNEFGSSLETDIVIIGDFNISPFEKPMIGFNGFAASNSKNLRKEAVSTRKRRKALYYNPTWTLYSRNIFPGTKYFKRPSGSSFDVLEHHFLDQVVLSYSMCKRITHESISVLESTASKIFFDSKRNKIILSDHLPLTYEYQLI